MKKLIKSDTELDMFDLFLDCSQLADKFVKTKIVPKLNKYGARQYLDSVMVPIAVGKLTSIEVFELGLKWAEEVSQSNYLIINVYSYYEKRFKTYRRSEWHESHSFEDVEGLEICLNNLDVDDLITKTAQAIETTKNSIQSEGLQDSASNSTVEYEVIKVVGDRGESTEFEETTWMCNNDICALTRALVDPDKNITLRNYKVELEDMGYDADSVSPSYLRDQLEGRELYDGAVICIKNKSTNKVLYEDEYFMDIYNE